MIITTEPRNRTDADLDEAARHDAAVSAMGTLARALDLIPLLYAEVGRTPRPPGPYPGRLPQPDRRGPRHPGRAGGRRGRWAAYLRTNSKPRASSLPIAGSGHTNRASRRQLRRRARQLRRDGFQPSTSLRPDEPLPETAGAIIVRALWRYRSEFAPIAAAAVTIAAAAAMHRPPPGMVAMGAGPHLRRHNNPGRTSAATAAQGMARARPGRRAPLRRIRQRDPGRDGSRRRPHLARSHHHCPLSSSS